MPTTLQLVEKALGHDKFAVLACAIDLLTSRMDGLVQEKPIDDQIACLDAHQLAEENGVSFETFRKNICQVMGTHAVFRLGKRWVLRKETFLLFLQKMETGAAADDQDRSTSF